MFGNGLKAERSIDFLSERGGNQNEFVTGVLL